MEQVGVRELRQNASKLLERVERGESVEVTNHGRAVALIVPVHAARRLSWHDLLDAGLVHRGHGDPLDIQPRPAPADSASTRRLLDELRSE